MKVLVAGASGALGSPTTDELLARGHEVSGLTRSEKKGRALEARGVTPVYGDVLDETAVERVVAEVRPDGIIQLLNALPKRGPMRPSEIEGTNELRRTGTKHLLAAAGRHGTKRFVVESMIFGYGYGDRGDAALTEDAPFGQPSGDPKVGDALTALSSMEEQVLAATERGALEGVILRLGLFYGPGVGSTDYMVGMLRKHLLFLPGGGKGLLSWIHIEDAARAVVDAFERALPGSVYNVTDDEPAGFGDIARALSTELGIPGPKSIPAKLVKPVGPYVAMMSNTNLRASNARIKRELGWAPVYPTIKEGVRTLTSPRSPSAVASGSSRPL
jgi:nucleoside-diphosphate-sugar epimerase